MTTIAYRDGELWADSLVTVGGTIVGECNKIYTQGNYVMGIAGDIAAVRKFLKNFDTEEPDDSAGDFQAIVIHKDTGTARTYTNSYEPEAFTADYYTIGSGADIALGALAQGASAKQAVQIACKLDVYSGGKVHGTHISK